jgi:hypothetical protein
MAGHGWRMLVECHLSIRSRDFARKSEALTSAMKIRHDRDRRLCTHAQTDSTT